MLFESSDKGRIWSMVQGYRLTNISAKQTNCKDLVLYQSAIYNLKQFYRYENVFCSKFSNNYKTHSLYLNFL